MEAEAYDGPSLIIAYSHCIQQGLDMRKGLSQQKLAVQSGYWPLYRYNPDLVDEGKNPLQIDSKEPTVSLDEYVYNETRFQMLVKSDEVRAELLIKEARQDVAKRLELYKQMAGIEYNAGKKQD